MLQHFRRKSQELRVQRLQKTPSKSSFRARAILVPEASSRRPERAGDWEIIADERGIRWSELDKDLSVEGITSGRGVAFYDLTTVDSVGGLRAETHLMCRGRITTHDERQLQSVV